MRDGQWRWGSETWLTVKTKLNYNTKYTVHTKWTRQCEWKKQLTLKIPDFWNAMDSMVSPRSSVCSKPREVIAQATGLRMKFVLSVNPPMPTSMTAMSTPSLRNMCNDNTTLKAKYAGIPLPSSMGYSGYKMKKYSIRDLTKVMWNSLYTKRCKCEQYISSKCKMNYLIPRYLVVYSWKKWFKTSSVSFSLLYTFQK